jgi:hypothetical protein
LLFVDISKQFLLIAGYSKMLALPNTALAACH